GDAVDRRGCAFGWRVASAVLGGCLGRAGSASAADVGADSTRRRGSARDRGRLVRLLSGVVVDLGSGLVEFAATGDSGSQFLHRDESSGLTATSANGRAIETAARRREIHAAVVVVVRDADLCGVRSRAAKATRAGRETLTDF